MGKRTYGQSEWDSYLWGCVKMKLNQGDIIKDGDDYFSIFCIMCSVIYVKRVSDIGKHPYYELQEIMKHYRKIEIMKN